MGAVVRENSLIGRAKHIVSQQTKQTPAVQCKTVVGQASPGCV